MKQLSLHPHSKITITKVKLSSYDEDVEPENQMTGLELGYSEELLGDEGALEFVREHPNVKLRNFLTHGDLINRFEALRPHMAFICEYADATQFEDDELENVRCKEMFVTQVTLTGDNENAGVVLTGFRLLADGSKLNLNTPNLKFDLTEYKFSNELSEAVDELIEEARKALVDRKRKIVQTELFDDEQATDDEFDFSGDLDKSVEKLKGTFKKHGVKVLVGESQS